jgi:hypothetical protein
MVDCARLNDFKIHQQQVGGGQHVDPQTYQNNCIENFTVFTGHWGPQKKLTNGKLS